MRRKDALNVVVVGRTTRSLGIHVAAMERRLWCVEWRDASSLFSTSRHVELNAVIIDQTSLPPGADAFKLATRARTEIGVPVVMLTSEGKSELPRAAQSAGCTCVSAPCRTSSLIAGVTTAIAIAGGTHWKKLRSCEVGRPR